MKALTAEFRRLEQAKSLIKLTFPDFGVNKAQEITRLLYEISKRENTAPARIINAKGIKNYNSLRTQLLRKRYPFATQHIRCFKPYLPKIELKHSDLLINRHKRRFYPRDIFIEKRVRFSCLVRRLKQLFPKSRFREINSLADYVHLHNKSGVKDYNQRQNTLFVINESYDFFKKCPCSSNTLSCGYHIFNLGFGCIFECNYCFLQGYTNSPGVMFPANIEGFFDRFNSYKKPAMRIGTGEFSDSLALDKITEYSIPIIEFFKKHEDVFFEFKTKSAEIKNVLKTNHSGNIVISWSLNPQKIIDDNELLTPTLNERLNAASKCVEAGYKVGFHFDPVIFFSGWEKQYHNLIEALFNKIKPRHIAWISIGTFRFNPRLKPIIERRFPENKILNEELLLGYDNKLRYPYNIRYNIYKEIISRLKKHSGKLNLYLCMEKVSMWKELDLKMPNW